MIIIGIAGGSGSGKTTLVNHVIAAYPKGLVSHLPLDAYYFDHSHLSETEKKQYNFDHPNAIEFDLLIEHLQNLKLHIGINRPVYSFLTCSRQSQTIQVSPAEVLLIDGLFTLFNEQLRNELSSKVFLDVRKEIRLERIVKRDTNERGRSRKGIVQRFLQMVDPMHEQFVEPTRKFADIIINGESSDIELNIQKIHSIIHSYVHYV